MRFLAFLFLVLLPVVAFSGESAAPPVAAKIEKAPHFHTLTEAQFEADSDLYEVPLRCETSPFYSIRLPKGWQRAQSSHLVTVKCADMTARELGRIAKYYSPQSTDMPSSLDLEALELSPPAISAQDWLLHYIRSNGYTLLGMNEISGARSEALYKRSFTKQSYIVRIAVESNGTRLEMASYQVPVEKWDQEKAMQEKVIASFRVLKPAKTSAPTDAKQ